MPSSVFTDPLRPRLVVFLPGRSPCPPAPGCAGGPSRGYARGQHVWNLLHRLAVTVLRPSRPLECNVAPRQKPGLLYFYIPRTQP